MVETVSQTVAYVKRSHCSVSPKAKHPIKEEFFLCQTQKPLFPTQAPLSRKQS